MIVYSFVSFTAFLVYLAMGVYVFRKSPWKRLSILFFLLGFALALWSFCYAFLYFSDSISVAWQWYHVALPAWVLLPVLFVHFFLVLREDRDAHPLLIPFMYLPAIFFVVYGQVYNLVISKINLGNNGPVLLLNTDSPFFWIFTAYAFLYGLAGLILILKTKSKRKSRKKTHQTRVMFATGVTVFILIVLTDVFLPLLHTAKSPGYAHLITGIWYVGIFIAIVRYQLFQLTPRLAVEQITQNMSDMLLLLDKTGMILEINSALEKTLKFGQDVLISHPFSRLIANQSDFSKIMEYLISAEPVCEFETELIAAGENNVPVKIRASKYIDRFGDLVGFTLIARDMRHLKMMEKEIEERKKMEVEVRYAHHELKLKHKELEEEQNKIRFKNEMMEIELSMARKIQSELIPSESPIPHLAFFYKPMEKVGGDFYDFIEINEGKTYGIFLSDVSGHGVPAAFITSLIKSHNIQYGSGFLDPSEYLLSLNDFLLNKTGENFITAFYAIYDLEERDFLYSNAGHNSPFLIKKNKLQRLSVEGRGIPLGILSRQELAMMSKSYTSHQLHLGKKNKVFIFTDGLTETASIYDKDMLFEQNELEKSLLEFRDLPSQIFIQKLSERLTEFRQSKTFEDDICMICLEST